jgi:hypothetical protein
MNLLQQKRLDLNDCRHATARHANQIGRGQFQPGLRVAAADVAARQPANRLIEDHRHGVGQPDRCDRALDATGYGQNLVGAGEVPPPPAFAQRSLDSSRLTRIAPGTHAIT